jgi:import inner membrane translocase subunit TIM23
MSSQSYPADPANTQGTSDLLKNVRFSSQSPDHLPEAPTASDLLSGSYDPAKLHPMASLGEQLDYLVLDDEKTSDLPGSGTAIPSRGWSDDLCYGTGTMYLGGTSCMLLAINTVIHNSSASNRSCSNFTLSAILLSFVLTTCSDLL